MLTGYVGEKRQKNAAEPVLTGFCLGFKALAVFKLQVG
jgi:hypothetical protein